MVIKVQYDARSHTFKLIDQDFRTLLEGDALYDLALPLMLGRRRLCGRSCFNCHRIDRPRMNSGAVTEKFGDRRINHLIRTKYC